MYSKELLLYWQKLGIKDGSRRTVIDSTIYRVLDHSCREKKPYSLVAELSTPRCSHFSYQLSKGQKNQPQSNMRFLMFMIQKDQSTRKLLLKLPKTPTKALFKYVSLGAKMFKNISLNHSLSPRHAEGIRSQASYVFPEQYSWSSFKA